MKKVLISISGGSFFIVLFYLFVIQNPALPAQAADAILRPLIGSKMTISLESWYFALGDQIKKVEYTYKKPDANIFVSPDIGTSQQNKYTNINVMDLAAIPIAHQFPQLPQEGVWQIIPERLFPKQIVMAKTFMRPDPTRSYTIVSLVKMDMKKISIGTQAGTYYPGGTHGVFGPGIVPKPIQLSNELLAVFNGGFMEKDGHYGMIVGDKTYVSLRNNLATFLIYSDGSANIINYQGQKFGKNVIAIRQNGAFLIQNGIVTPFVESSIDTWGRTTTNSMYTWRSGIGITKEGNLIYAVGNSLIPQTLAKALQEAGAVTAMQLDINPYWVRFIIYSSLGNGTYTYSPLLKDMHNGGYNYLHGYNKDFFYIYKKI